MTFKGEDMKSMFASSGGLYLLATPTDKGLGDTLAGDDVVDEVTHEPRIAPISTTAE